MGSYGEASSETQRRRTDAQRQSIVVEALQEGHAVSEGAERRGCLAPLSIFGGDKPWSACDMVTSISHRTWVASFDYGPDQQRFRRVDVSAAGDQG